MSDSFSAPSLTVSAMGWVLAVVAVALALFVGKPYYQKMGYDEGRKTQAASNIAAVDQIISNRSIEGKDYVVLGHLISKGDNTLVIQSQNPILNNPLRNEARTQTITIDASTIMEKRTLLGLDQFVKAEANARDRGLTTADAKVHEAEPLTLDQLPIGSDIRVYPKVAQDATKDTFAAKQILWVISNQNQPTN